jgi:hypothetical protein
VGCLIASRAVADYFARDQLSSFIFQSSFASSLSRAMLLPDEVQVKQDLINSRQLRSKKKFFKKIEGV